MSLVDVKGVNLVPGWMSNWVVAPWVRWTTLDADGEKCGGIIRISKTGNISKIAFRTYTAIPVSDAIKVSLQTVDDSNGRPTGTLIHVDAYGVQASISANTTYWVSLQNPVAVTIGDKVAVVLEFNSYVAGNVRILYGLANVSSQVFPYSFIFVGSVWTFINALLNFGFEYDDGNIESTIGTVPAIIVSTVTWNDTDNPDRRGLRFSVSYNCRIYGVFANIDLDGNADIEIYDNDGTTLLETILLDKDLRIGTGVGMFFRNLVTPIELTKNTFYRIVIHPTTGTNITIYTLDVTDDGAAKAMNAIDGGVNFHYTTVNGSPSAEGDYTQTLTRRPSIGLMIDQLDDGLPLNIVSGAVVTGQDTVGTIVGE